MIQGPATVAAGHRARGHPSPSDNESGGQGVALAGECGACGENGARWNQEFCTGANLPGRFHTQLSFYRFRNSSTGGKGLRLWAAIGFAVFRVRQMGDGGALDVPICDTRVRSSMTYRRRWARMRCAV